jgi:hypothetical protein
MIKSIMFKILKIIVSLVITVCIFMFFRWTGLAGILSYVLGMLSFAVLIFHPKTRPVLFMLTQFAEGNDQLFTLNDFVSNNQKDNEVINDANFKDKKETD